MQIGDALVCQIGQKSKTIWQFNINDSKIGLQSFVKSRNNLRKFQAGNRGIFKNSQLQIKFTGSYKKREYLIYINFRSYIEFKKTWLHLYWKYFPSALFNLILILLLFSWYIVELKLPKCLNLYTKQEYKKYISFSEKHQEVFSP